MELTKTLSAAVGISDACQALTVSRATFYRSQLPPPPARPLTRRRSGRALSETERAETLSVLHSEEFSDRAPAAVCATLLDRGRYLCSPRTMYRLLAEQDEVRERRSQLIHPHYQAPELLATVPNQVWSWDITKLRGLVKWTYYYLYVAGHLQPLRHGLDGGHARERGVGQAVTLRELSQARHRFGPTDRSFRSRLVNDFQASGFAAGRSRRDPQPEPAARLERQSVLGKSVQDAEVLFCIS